VLDRAGKLTPGGLRAAIRHAVIEVNPEKARKQREKAAQQARVERWAEDSGNAGLAGRELPPADVLAADQRISWWARQLRKAGLDGDMDQLRAIAYMDIFLGRDSRRLAPAAGGENRHDGGPDDGGRGSDGPGSGPGDGGSGPQDPPDPGLPPTAGVLPVGFTGHINLTVPLSTQLGLADRPGGILKREIFRREIVRVNRRRRRLERADGLALGVGDAGVKIERKNGVRRIFADDLEETFFALDVNQLLVNARLDVDDDRILSAARRHGHDGFLHRLELPAAILSHDQIRLRNQRLTGKNGRECQQE